MNSAVNSSSQPLVSILIPCFNAALWIDQTLESCCSQTWPAIEVIVIDDGSTDGSPDLLKQWDQRAKVLCRGNRGGNPTRNELLSMASGHWIQFLDADDYLLPEKISNQMQTAQATPSADVIYSPQLVEIHTPSAISTQTWNPHDPTGAHDPWTYHLGWNLTQTGGALFRKTVLDAIGGWNEQQPCCQDNELYFRLLQHGANFVYCPYAESVYRRFENGSVSTGKPDRVRAEILSLLQKGEQFLRQSNALTAQRLQAINQMRFRIARTVWPDNPAEAKSIIATIHFSDPRFVPLASDQAPSAYRWCYRLLGFVAAEKVGEFRRRFC